MSNPPKQKGTGGETELLKLLAERGVHVVRNPAGARTDLSRPGLLPIKALATRPDYGEWLLTVNLDDFCELVGGVWPLEIECKRWKRFAHHTLFKEELG